ncbi:hypothetical protein Raf01_57960 [Rugosimonospora africana]|uniref:Uncharacterized protein n=1 Tax=Rugosimonospora africana TaxID=556532 RepID=A0A8J3QWF9_9ACTN|nr:hypothetical protein Raf01_57960 [Rugosimonospora africana]
MTRKYPNLRSFNPVSAAGAGGAVVGPIAEPRRPRDARAGPFSATCLYGEGLICIMTLGAVGVPPCARPHHPETVRAPGPLTTLPVPSAHRRLGIRRPGRQDEGATYGS